MTLPRGFGPVSCSWLVADLLRPACVISNTSLQYENKARGFGPALFHDMAVTTLRPVMVSFSRQSGKATRRARENNS
jgi:hypothetical protein